MKGVPDWIDRRTGLARAWRACFLDPIPGGAKWRHTWSTAVAFAFFMQVVTGFFLLAHYSASTQTAWESVYYLQNQVPGGWLVRALHVVTAQAFVVLLGLHLFQVIIHQAYTAPGELNFLLLLGLLPLAIALSTTGWLLPLDQKGYWAAKVPINIMSIAPVVGPAMQQVLLGGAEFSHLTLTRFAALHTTLLPVCTGLLLGTYLVLVHRHRVTAPMADSGGDARLAPGRDSGRSGPSDAPYWPDQALRDAVACVAVMVVVLGVILLPRLLGHGEAGAELLAPAEPTEAYSAARPEWFMLWLFQFLKFFAGGTEVWGAVVIPSAVLALMAAMPWIGRWRLGRAFNTTFVCALGGAVVVLGAIAFRHDRANPEYQKALREAHAAAARARELAKGPEGIPVSGARTLLREDPLTQGPRLFAQHCASCHRYEGHDGLGRRPEEDPSAPDLAGFASREWLAGLLDPDRIVGPKYFGGTRFNRGRKGKMVRFVTGEVADFSPGLQEQLQKVIIAVSAEASLPAQSETDARDAESIREGRELARNEDMTCTDCHPFREPDEDATAPDLTGYGSRAWMIEFISNPEHERFYGGRNDRMPLFGVDAVLSDARIGLIADWLRGDWRRAEDASNSP